MHCLEVYHILKLIPAKRAGLVCQALISVKKSLLKFVIRWKTGWPGYVGSHSVEVGSRQSRLEIFHTVASSRQSYLEIFILHMFSFWKRIEQNERKKEVENVPVNRWYHWKFCEFTAWFQGQKEFLTVKLGRR